MNRNDKQKKARSFKPKCDLNTFSTLIYLNGNPFVCVCVCAFTLTRVVSLFDIIIFIFSMPFPLEHRCQTACTLLFNIYFGQQRTQRNCYCSVKKNTVKKRKRQRGKYISHSYCTNIVCDKNTNTNTYSTNAYKSWLQFHCLVQYNWNDLTCLPFIWQHIWLVFFLPSYIDRYNRLNNMQNKW